MDELNDVLNGTDSQPEPQPEPQPELMPESMPESQPEPQKGNDLPDARELEGMRRAYMAEKEKRQTYERQMQEWQRQQQEKEKPDFWDAPEQHLNQLKSEFEQTRLRDRIELSEMFAESRYEDFAEKRKIFMDLAIENPLLWQQLQSERNPAEFAYKTAANHLKLQEMGNPEEYEKKLETKLREKLQKEFEAKLNAELEKRNIPPSLTEARGAGNKTVPEWSGPAPLSSILK